MFTGYGYTGWLDGAGKLWLGRPSKIGVSSELKLREILGYPHQNPTGMLQTVDAAPTSEIFSCSVETGSFDKYEISRIFDQALATTDTISLPVTETVQIPLSGTYDIAIPGLIANQQVGVFIESLMGARQLSQTTQSSPADGFYKVNTDTVLFNAAQAGLKPVIQYFKTYTDVETLGVEQSAALGELAFFGRVIGPRFSVGPLFYIPRMVRASGVDLGEEFSKITYRPLLKSPFSKPITFAFDVSMP